MRGALDIVASRAPKNTPEGEFTEIARKELVRLDSLIGDFLAYARPREPERRLTSLSAVLERVTVLLRPQAERAQVTVETQGLEQLPSLMIDPDQIAQVFINIGLNGVQASPPGGTLRIEASTTATTVVIDVIDQGPGIPAQHHGRLFEPFFTTKPQGTGLGLALSQRIVAAHDGTIELHAATPSGTIVRVMLRKLAQSLGHAQPCTYGDGASALPGRCRCGGNVETKEECLRCAVLLHTVAWRIDELFDEARRFLPAGVKDTLPTDRDRILARLSSILADPRYGKGLRDDLRIGLPTLPAWMQDIVRELLGGDHDRPITPSRRRRN